MLVTFWLTLWLSRCGRILLWTLIANAIFANNFCIIIWCWLLIWKCENHSQCSLSIHSNRYEISVIKFVLAIKLADAFALAVDGAGDCVVVGVGVGLAVPNTISILLLSSSIVFVTPVTISIGAPFFPIKNSDGNGTNLSTKIQTKQFNSIYEIIIN